MPAGRSGGAAGAAAAAGAAWAVQSVGMRLGRSYGPVAGGPWFVDQAQGGGQILERGSHHIDLQRALAGEVVAAGAVASAARLAQSDGGASIDDALVLLLHFRSGALGTVHTAWSRDGQPELYATDVIASDATISLELGPARYRIDGVSGGEPLEGEYADPMERSIGR